MSPATPDACAHAIEVPASGWSCPVPLSQTVDQMSLAGLPSLAPPEQVMSISGPVFENVETSPAGSAAATAIDSGWAAGKRTALPLPSLPAAAITTQPALTALMIALWI